MEHVIIRKPIRLQVVIYILVALAGIPAVSYKILYEVKFRSAMSEVRSLFEEKRYPECEARLSSLLLRYGPRTEALRFDLELSARLAFLDNHAPKWYKVLQLAALLEDRFGVSKTELALARGDAYFHLGHDHYDQGILAYKSVTIPKVREAEITDHLYVMALARRHWKEAETQAARLAAMYPGDPEYRLRQVLVDLARGEKLRAQESLKSLLVTVPAGPALKRSSKLLLALLTEFSLTEERRFVHLYLLHQCPDDPEYIADYGNFLFQNQQIYPARTLVWEAIKKNQTNLLLRQTLARMF